MNIDKQSSTPEAARPSPALLTAASAATYLNMTPNALAKLRVSGQGPSYFKLPGARAVMYSLEDLRRWLDAHRCRSTSERHA